MWDFLGVVPFLVPCPPESCLQTSQQVPRSYQDGSESEEKKTFPGLPCETKSRKAIPSHGNPNPPSGSCYLTDWRVTGTASHTDKLEGTRGPDNFLGGTLTNLLAITLTFSLA